MTPVQIKICGVTNIQDATACVELGVNMIGFNFYPESVRYIEPKAAERIIETLPPDVRAVGVFVDTQAEKIRNTADAAGVRCVQLHGPMSAEAINELAGELDVIRAFSTDSQFRPEELSLFGHCEVLLDAHHPTLRGGTGLTCNWQAARTARSFAQFLILSGGLCAKNVGEAIATVSPHAVDVCSGVESTPGTKDHRALEDFVTAVREALPC
jgi:phosphoribosylanthranilate isomerase